MGDRAGSVENLDRACATTEALLRQSLTKALSSCEIRYPKRTSIRIRAEEQKMAHLRCIIKDGINKVENVSAYLRKRQLPLIAEAMNFWSEDDTVRNSKSPNPGLGTLGILPLEIRDMIFELATSPPEDYPRYELPLQSIQHAKSRISEVISPRIRTQGSRQLYRELLEAFLWTTPIEVHPYNVERLEQILSGLDLVADITKHTRIIRVVHPSSSASLDNRYQVARSFPRIFDSLRGCQEQYGIPASSFCYFVRYERFYYRVFRPFEQTLGALLNENFNYYFGTVNRGQYIDIDIAMGDREKSIRNMHQACERNERKIRELFKDLANDPRIPETVRQDHRLRAVYEEAISQAVAELAIIKARHLLLIEQAILCWQVEDDKEPETKDQQPLSFGDKTQTTGKPYKKPCRHQQLSARSRYVALHPLKSS
ncbi:hypothetical protein D6D06_01493 [Aureobasidium pullulans]|nr:hypothetical protein D6D06_01493 [Aureobasidium pullulans]